MNLSKTKKKKTLVLAIKYGFAYIAFWQLLGFIILLLFIWANEFLGLSSYFFHTDYQQPDFIRATIASIGIILSAIIVIGTTYQQQTKIISEMLTVCSYCHKIIIDDESWHLIEKLINENPSLRISHGICNSCLEKEQKSWDDEEKEI